MKSPQSLTVKFENADYDIDIRFSSDDEAPDFESDIDTLKKELRKSLANSGYSTHNRLSHKALSNEKMNCLAYHAQKGCTECQELIVIFCGRLIHKQVKKAVSQHHGDPTWDYNDLFNSGCIGVLMSLKTWDMSKGHFTSWAMYGIIGKITEEKKRLYSPIMIKDETLWKLSLSLPYLSLTCKMEYGKPVSDQEFVDWINEYHPYKREITIKDIHHIQQITGIRSLEEQVDYENTDSGITRLVDTIEDPQSQAVDDGLLEQEKIKLLNDLLSQLTRKQELTVRLYHKIDKETQGILGKVTFSDVACILTQRYPNETWSIKACQESNRRGLERLRQIAYESDIDISDIF